MGFTDFSFISEVVDLKNESAKEKVREFLAASKLKYEENVDFTQIYRIGEEIVATGSLSHNIIKCVAVSPSYRGSSGILAKLMTKLVIMLYKRGYTHHYIFTKPRYVRTFITYGFHEVVRAEPYVALLEHGIQENIHKYVKRIEEKRKSGDNIGAMIIDCNPITYDHIIAITEASKFSDWLHLFLVSEPKYLFPLKIRLKLLQESIANLNNVTIHLGGNYIVSHLTFPKYFIRKEEASRAHALLGGSLFGKYIVPTLNIKHRYIRKEPDSELDSIYNAAMKELLPKFGVQIHEIPNLMIDGHYMSAKLFKELIDNNDWEEIKKMVTPATYEFLISEEAEPILNRIRSGKEPYERV